MRRIILIVMSALAALATAAPVLAGEHWTKTDILQNHNETVLREMA